MTKRAFRATGIRLIGAQGVPAELVARYVRRRGLPGGYGYTDMVAPGWQMTVWATDASRERYWADARADQDY